MTRGLAPVDVAVVGTGLAAAAIALELARRDLTVELLAEGMAGRPSSPGGPVAAQAVPAATGDARFDLALLSRHLFSDWISALEEETGLSCEYDERGAMTVALEEEEEVALDRALDVQRARSLHFEVLEPDEARGREPAVTPRLRAAFAFSRDGVVRAGRVGRALVLAARVAGARVREGAVVESVDLAGGRVAGLATSTGLLPAEVVVLAGVPRLGLSASSRPWLRLDATSDPDRPARLLVSAGACLVPRRDGTLLAFGAADRDGGSGRASAGHVAALLSEVARLVPASTGWSLLEAGAALERSTPDGRPVLGETETAGLFVAAGWGGDELLLVPAVAALTADLVGGRTPPLPAAPFAPGRLGSGPGRNGIVPG